MFRGILPSVNFRLSLFGEVQVSFNLCDFVGIGCILGLSMLCVVLLSSVPHWVIVFDNIIDNCFLALRLSKPALKIGTSLMCGNCRAWIYVTLLLCDWCSMHISLALSFILPRLFWWAWNCGHSIGPPVCSWKLLRYCCYWWLSEFLTCFDIPLFQDLLLIFFIVIVLTHEIFSCPPMTGKVIQSSKSFRSSEEWRIF